VDGSNPDGSSEIFVVKTDGSGWRRLTSDPLFSSITPDISGAGSRIAFSSEADPVGTNSDHNAEIFLHDTATGTTRQLTATAGADCRHPRISDDGEFVYFTTAAPIFESDPNGRTEGYRVSVSTGVVERIGAIRRGPSSLGSSDIFQEQHVATDATGRLGVMGSPGDWIGRDPDFDRELYVADQTASARLLPSNSSPTVLSWDPEPRSLRYDVVRGDLANLRIIAGSVDLGSVVCLENDSPDTDTLGFEDPAEPGPGQAFFFLHRGSQGVNDGPGTFGFASNGFERIAGVGDCPP
jgi:hypothetical protein